MASGDIVAIIHEVMFPGANPATPDVRVGGSTPAESFSVYDFDATTDEMLDFKCTLWFYDSGGLTVPVAWAASSATSGNTVWQAAIRRIQDDAEDMDSSHTYDYNSSGQCTAPSASGELSYDNITFTDGADMDSVADGEAFILRLRRDADSTSATDDMTGDAEFFSLVITET